MTTPPLKPFLKWAGGKRWLFETKQFSLPDIKKRYIEPFLGGGAVFFEHQPKPAILSDSNARLIELYEVIRDELAPFESALRAHAACHSKDYYYSVRQRRMETPVSRAAQFLYLNRTCWNGLYRENKKGEFNVPIGTRGTVIFETDNFSSWSEALKYCKICCADFEKAIDSAGDGDFLFVDPPYTVRHNMNGFVRYNQNIFAWDDQVRLRDALVRAAKRGASIAMTNADHESIRELYKGFGTSVVLSRKSLIAGNNIHRSDSTELLIVV